MRVAWGLMITMAGAVLAFAVTADVYTIHAIGWILLLAGLFLLVFGVVRGQMTRHREVRVRVDRWKQRRDLRRDVQRDDGE